MGSVDNRVYSSDWIDDLPEDEQTIIFSDGVLSSKKICDYLLDKNIYDRRRFISKFIDTIQRTQSNTGCTLEELKRMEFDPKEKRYCITRDGEVIRLEQIGKTIGAKIKDLVNSNECTIEEPENGEEEIADGEELEKQKKEIEEDLCELRRDILEITGKLIDALKKIDDIEQHLDSKREYGCGGNNSERLY